MNPKWLAFVLMCLSGASSSLAAEPSTYQGPYIGLFGGLGSAGSASMLQQGMVLNLPRPLPIHASGSTPGGTRIAMGGIQLGYEWNQWKPRPSAWSLGPALELEAFYIGKYTPTGELRVIPRALGTQYVSAPTTAGVVLANAIFNLQTPYSEKIFPYVGLGAGAAFLSIRGSDSANPSEPGINHFNSDPDASSSAFAIQVKAGIKGEISKNLFFFTEYRHLSLNSTSYTFGATDYPGLHLPTTLWHVDLGRQRYNMVVAGLQYKF